MNKFEKLKTIIEREYEKKKSDLEKHGFKYGIKKISLYRKEGWRDCLKADKRIPR